MIMATLFYVYPNMSLNSEQPSVWLCSAAKIKQSTT